jgi:WD40 repeat protein
VDSDPITFAVYPRENPDAGFTSLAVTPDGNYLISASPDTTVLVWSVKAGANLLNNPKGRPKVITLSQR